MDGSDHVKCSVDEDNETENAPVADATAQIESLRRVLVKKPRNAKIMSQLAYLLATQSKLKKVDNLPDPALLEEAISLAQNATTTAPQKPFGFAALSTILPDFGDRQSSLHEAIARTTEPQHVLARATLLVRLLVEPRDQEARLVRGTLGSSSSKHPSKRPLNAKEEATYADITKTLDEAWQQQQTTLPPSENMSEQLAKLEYRLGLFFRKKQPPQISQERASKHFQKVCDALPQKHGKWSMAQFWLATLSDTTTLQKCPQDYIVGLYSTFAPRFDTLLLESLNYTTPTELRKLVDEVANTKSGWAQRAVDLGCGTGLSGKAFRDCVAGHFVGVDLSPDMLDKAKERKVYDETIQGDCLQGLSQKADTDLITACDVFVYIGDLQDIFVAAYQSLSANGRFAFSTELLELDQDSTVDYVLHECARFAHSKAYIECLAADVGLEFCGHKVCAIRKNQGKDVLGSLVVLSKGK
ncbi:Probable 18S rRNA (guanine-N(7))-methyltransferase [Seminavis robusta]|uniref:Probable 18S rRNA (Guanine-N(7))-methyltransferase n=1 Tax=Seminavis robusta TaxID=568900 RepID=A0A9N8H405_9STRA|nr:Probable 18S rRNA (guanine-N(7))-methyltransferase [Seminavis robusta]|eukprot:Sro101_g051630.1 Probable 18S rRNA (guanine-N(7))-methyltransferase (470) ;mRNA; r:59955-61364